MMLRIRAFGSFVCPQSGFTRAPRSNPASRKILRKPQFTGAIVVSASIRRKKRLWLKKPGLKRPWFDGPSAGGGNPCCELTKGFSTVTVLGLLFRSQFRESFLH